MTMKPMSIQAHIKKKARFMYQFPDITRLDHAIVSSSGLPDVELGLMCYAEMARQERIRVERRGRRPGEQYVANRYHALLEDWRRSDQRWQATKDHFSAIDVITVLNYMKTGTGPISMLPLRYRSRSIVVSDYLIQFRHDEQSVAYGKEKKHYYKQVNRRLVFHVYDRRNHCLLEVATAPVVRWTEKSVATVLFDTLAALPPAWMSTMNRPNLLKEQIRAGRLPPHRLP